MATTKKAIVSKDAIAALNALIEEYDGNLMELAESMYGGGVCLSCGDIQDCGVEPDAEGYACNACGVPSVMGLENALLRFVC